jgi:hypothetical protein
VLKFSPRRADALKYKNILLFLPVRIGLSLRRCYLSKKADCDCAHASVLGAAMIVLDKNVFMPYDLKSRYFIAGVVFGL